MRSTFKIQGWLGAIVTSLSLLFSDSARSADSFAEGVEAYRAGNHARAVEAFGTDALERPSSGALQNLGNAEWRRGSVGDAILAWERALWVNAFDHNARNNLRVARDEMQLEAPELTWYEAVSGWLPVNWWAWVTALSLWTAVGVITLPEFLRRRRRPWQQAVAALALGVLLLTLPAHAGTFTRARVGFVLSQDAILRLTPTAGAEAVTRLAVGEPVRRLRSRGNFIFVRTNHSTGWLQENQIGLIRPK